VFYEFADLILWLANLGVECLRLDAIAFLFKRMGTNCQNQPEVHASPRRCARWPGSAPRR
jgi:amylosucrase